MSTGLVAFQGDKVMPRAARLSRVSASDLHGRPVAVRQERDVLLQRHTERAFGDFGLGQA